MSLFDQSKCPGFCGYSDASMDCLLSGSVHDLGTVDSVAIAVDGRTQESGRKGGTPMRRTIALIAGSALVVAMLPAQSASAARQGDPGPSAAERAALSAGSQVAPKQIKAGTPAGVNPYLALVPDPTKVDYAAWQKWMKAQGQARATQKAAQRRLAGVADPRRRAGTVRTGLERLARHGAAGAGLRHEEQAEQPRADPRRAHARGGLRRRRSRRTPRTTARSRWPATPASSACATASPPPARSATGRTARPAATPVTSTSTS